MNILTDARRATIVRALCAGNSILATGRLTQTAKATVLKLLVELGGFCSIYQDHALRNLKTQRVEADEIWAFVGAKAKNATKDGQGDIWTYTALDADSKLMISWLVGTRDSGNTQRLMADVAERVGNHVRLTRDGLGWHQSAVESAFSWNGVDFAQIATTYGIPMDEAERQHPHSAAVHRGASKTPITNDLDADNLSTSYVERSNLSMGMWTHRLTRLMNGFSKKAENHTRAISLFFMHYNYCKANTTLTKAAKEAKTTPAMSAGLTDHVWTVEEIIEKVSLDYPSR